MRIHNLYTDANGQSHFRDIEVEWVEVARGDLHAGIEVDDVLPARRRVPVEIVIGLHLAENDAEIGRASCRERV